MNIEHKKTINFGDAPKGPFINEGIVYLKTDEVALHNDLHDILVNAVNLETHKLSTFDDSCQVLPVEAKVVVL